MEPITDDLAGENHGVLSEREVLELDGIGRRPRIMQGAHEDSVFAVLQRQVNGVPTADEYFETACHRARVDRSGRPVRGQPELTRRSIGSGLPPPCGETSHAARVRPHSRRQFRAGQLRDDGSCHDRPGRGLRNPSRELAAHDPRLTPAGARCGEAAAWSRSTSSHGRAVAGSSCRPSSPHSWRNTAPRRPASARSPARSGRTAGGCSRSRTDARSTRRWTARSGSDSSATPESGPPGCTTRATPQRPCGVPEVGLTS
jgi:hypothetical protein